MIDNTRRTGRTTALLKAAKEINAVFVCPTWEMAKIVSKYPEAEGVTVVGMNDPMRTVGFQGPFIYDHTVLEQTAVRLNILLSNVQKHKTLMDKIREVVDG